MGKFKGIITGRGKDGKRYRDAVPVNSPSAPEGADRQERRTATDMAAWKVQQDLLPGERIIYVGPDNPPGKS
jgi:hypothetical protein